jgi:hypothetical protein
MRSVAITELDILARRRCHHGIARRFGHWNWGSVTGLSKPLRAAQSLKPPALPGDTYHDWNKDGRPSDLKYQGNRVKKLVTKG